MYSVPLWLTDTCSPTAKILSSSTTYALAESTYGPQNFLSFTKCEVHGDSTYNLWPDFATDAYAVIDFGCEVLQHTCQSLLCSLKRTTWLIPSFPFKDNHIQDLSAPNPQWAHQGPWHQRFHRGAVKGPARLDIAARGHLACVQLCRLVRHPHPLVFYGCGLWQIP